MLDDVARLVPDLVTYVLWVPVLPDDDAVSAAREAQRRFAGPRVVGYWDAERTVADPLGAALELPARAGRPHGTAWDVYLVFPRGARWGARPAFWMHQLEDVPVNVAPRLDIAALSAKIVALGAGARSMDAIDAAAP